MKTLSLFFVSLSLFAQSQVNINKTFNGNVINKGIVDNRLASATFPNSIGLIANIPVNCAIGQTYWATDRTPPTYKCTTLNTWVQDTTGGSGSNTFAGLIDAPTANSALATLLNLKAPLASPVFTGQPTVPDFTNAVHAHTGVASGGLISHLSLTNVGTNSHAQIDTSITASSAHIANISNPHSTTAAQVGLSNVLNVIQEVPLTFGGALARTVNNITIVPSGVTNTMLLNPSMTINGTLCSLGATCAPSGSGGLGDPGSNGLLKRTAVNTTAPAIAGTDYQIPIVAGTGSSNYAAGNDARITGALQGTNNLSDVASPSTARTNLGLGTAATTATSAYDAAGAATAAQAASLQKTSNLSDLVSAATARTNLGIPALPVGAVVGTTDVQSLSNKTVDGVSPATMAFVDTTSSIQTQLNTKQTTLGFTAQNSATANVNNEVPLVFTGAAVRAGNTINVASTGGLADPGSNGLLKRTAVNTTALAVAGTDYQTPITTPVGAIVGTTDTQTLTNKTVDGVTPTTLAFVDATSSIQTQLNGKLTVNRLAVSSSATPSFSVAASTSVQLFDYTFSANVTSSTLVTTSATLGQHIVFVLNASAGSLTFVWPTNVTGAGLVALTSGGTFSQEFMWDGTNAKAVTTPQTTGSPVGTITLSNGVVLTLPSASNDTLVTLTATQTLTNKTVNGVSPATLIFVDATSSIQTQLNSKQATLGFTAQNSASPDVNNAGITTCAGTGTTQQFAIGTPSGTTPNCIQVPYNAVTGTPTLPTFPTGTVVGTTDVQALTNKTVDGVSAATMAFIDPTSSVQTQLNGKQPSLGFTAQNAATADVNNEVPLTFTGAAVRTGNTVNVASTVGLADPGSNGLVKRTATNTTVAAVSGTDYQAPISAGTTAGTYAVGNDSRIVGALQAANNLSDVPVAATARTNLGIPALPTGTIVGTTDTQTLTNKTVDGVSPATMAFVDPSSSIQTQLNSKGAGTVTHTAAAITVNAILAGGSGGADAETPSATTTLDSSGNISTPGALTSGVGGTGSGIIAFPGGTQATSITAAPTNSTGHIGPSSAPTGKHFVMDTPLVGSAGNQFFLFGAEAGNVSTGVYTNYAQTIAATANNWLTGFTASTGVFTASQPASTNLSDSALLARLASPALTGTATAVNLTVTGTCTGCSTGGTNYQTVKNAGTAVTQRPTLNFVSGVNCVDNAGSTQTDCTGTGGGSALGGVNAQTVGYTLISGDSGKLVTMNGTSLTASLPATPPSATWTTNIQNLNTTSLTISRNGLLINGAANNLTLLPYQFIPIYTDGTNYFARPPYAAGTNVTIASNPNNLVINSSATVNQNLRSVGFAFDGGGVAISGTKVGCTEVLSSGTISSVYTTADVSGSATIDIRTVAFASYTGTAGFSGYTSIVASAPPSLSSAVSLNNNTLTGWTTALTSGTMVCFQESSPATLTNLQVKVVYAAN